MTRPEVRLDRGRVLTGAPAPGHVHNRANCYHCGMPSDVDLRWGFWEGPNVTPWCEWCAELFRVRGWLSGEV